MVAVKTVLITQHNREGVVRGRHPAVVLTVFLLPPRTLSPGFHTGTAVSVRFLLTQEQQQHVLFVTNSVVTARRQAGAQGFSVTGGF